MANDAPADLTPYAPIGTLIRNLRLRRGLERAELAAAVGVDGSYLSRIEKGERRPSLKLLKAFAVLLDCPFEELAVASGILAPDFAARPSEPTDANELTQLLRGMIHQIQATPGRSVEAAGRRAVPVYEKTPAGLLKDARVVLLGDEVPQLVLSDSELGHDPRAYAVEVSGDSMTEAGILEGDILIVSPNTRVMNGDIAVVAVDKTATSVKKVFLEDETIILQPCNSHYRPQVLPAGRVEILGKVILVRRSLL